MDELRKLEQALLFQNRAYELPTIGNNLLIIEKTIVEGEYQRSK